MTQGIFVLGEQRSGTIMIANILVSQTGIVGATHHKHYGQT